MVFMKFFKTKLAQAWFANKNVGISGSFLWQKWQKLWQLRHGWRSLWQHGQFLWNNVVFQALVSPSQYSLIITRSLCALLRCALSTELCTRQRPELTRSSEHGILSYALSGVWMRVARYIITFITWRQAMSGKCPRCNLLTNLALRYRETTGKFIALKNKSKRMYLGSSCLVFKNKVSFPSINAE